MVNWAAFIFLLHALPGSSLPSHSFLALISFDKFVHFSMFFILNGLLIDAMRKQTAFRVSPVGVIFFSTIFCVFYCGVLEVFQGTFFKERSADMFDFIADVIGVFLSIFLFEKIIDLLKLKNGMEF